MDLYNISKYSDQELYQILELSGAASDRELEAKLIFNIDKYKDIATKDGRAIHRFFVEVYDHFFESDQDEDQQSQQSMSDKIINPILNFLSSATKNISYDLTEGFVSTNDLSTGTLPGGGNIKLSGGTSVNNANIPPTGQTNADISFNIGTPSPNKSTTTVQKMDGPNYTSSLTYTQGKLNPILKETIRRIISIDSQYRDIPVYPSTTNFSFNLSDTLVDVVSLKLYSVQIPYTWYTINGNFGSNFFYIKGNSPGIGDSDAAIQYQILVPSGNYTQQTIITAVSTSINTLKTISNDVSFNTSDITYNSLTVKSVLTLDITQIYDESWYELYFIGAESPQDPAYNLLSISSILGFNNSTYSPTTVYSRTFKSTNISNSSYPYYDVSANNPTTSITQQLAKMYTFTTPPSFNVFLYKPNPNLQPPNIDYTKLGFVDVSYVPISVPPLTPLTTYINTIYNCIKITSSLTAGTSYSGTQIMTDLNLQIANNPYFTSDSQIQPVYVNNSTTQLSTGIQRFSMNIHLNRKYANLNNYGLKTAIQFPNELNNAIFSDPYGGGDSLFQFPSPITDMSFITLNNFITESPALLTQYNIVDSVKCPYILAQCQLPGYNNSFNDYIFQFPYTTTQPSVTYDSYISGFTNASSNKLYYSQPGTGIAFSNTISSNDLVDICFNRIAGLNPQINDISFNINRNFYNNDYDINITNTGLTNYMGFVNDISFVDYHSTIYSYCPSANLHYNPNPPNSTIDISSIANTSVQITYYGTSNTTISTRCSFAAGTYSDINALLTYLSSTINSTMNGLYYNTSYTSNTNIANTAIIYLDCSYNTATYTDTSFNNPNNINTYRFHMGYTLPRFRIDMTGSVLFDDYKLAEIIGPTIINQSNQVITVLPQTTVPTSFAISNDKITVTSTNVRTPGISSNIALSANAAYSKDTYISNVNSSVSQYSSSTVNNYNINNSGNIILAVTGVYTNFYQFKWTFNICTNISTKNYKVSFYSASAPAAVSSQIYITPSTAFNTWTSSLNIWYNYFNIPSTQSSVSLTSNVFYVPCDLRCNTVYINDTNRYFMVRPKLNLNYTGVHTNVVNSTANPNPLVIPSYNYNDILYDLLDGAAIGTSAQYTTIQGLITAMNTTVQSQTSILNTNIIVRFDLYDTTTYANSNGLSRQYTRCNISVNQVYTTNDYRLVFYDPYSFVFCNSGLSTNSAQNTTWDATLGWLLGFRSLTEYYLTSQNMGIQYPGLTPSNYYIDTTTGALYTTTEYIYNPANNIVTITGDTSVNVSLYNYFMIILDDYCQNHLNDGLVTIISSASDIALPSYANRSTMICSPNGSSTIVNGAGLTQAQIYSASQIHQQQQAKVKSYSSGPFVHDVFAIIPIKTSGLASGSTYIEFGGSLQLQDRTYFGPVNIRKLTVKLIDDKGSVVSLNNANWSFSLVCEQLYNPNPQK